MKLVLAHDHELATGVLGLAVTPEGSQALAACADGGLHLVDLRNGQVNPFERRHASFASGCVLLPDGQTAISGGYDGQLVWHDVETRRSWRRVSAHQFWNWQLALSPDGRRLATVTGQYLSGSWDYLPADETEPSVKVFDTWSGDRVAAFSHTPPVLSCAFHPDGRHLAAANMMGEVRVWDLRSADRDPLVAQWKSVDFTSWGTIKTHHYCGGIYSLAFSPDGAALLGCGMGPMKDPMAGNGKMTWQRWDWRNSAPIDRIKEGQQGSGLMECVVWHPDGTHFLMAGRQAQGTWNTALFSAADGGLVDSLDTKSRITHARFTADGHRLVLAGALAQSRKEGGEWPAWGRVRVYRVEA
jgi:WD40 repeat protein